MNTLPPSDPPGSTLYDGGSADGLRAGLHQLDPLLALPEHPTAARPGLPFARYLLVSRLGSGRFGLVLLGDDPALNRPVVVKVPQPGVLGDRDLVTRFAREGHAAARLEHPGIVPVHDAGIFGGLPYLAAGYVPGPTLSAWRKTHPGPLPHADAARFLLSAALAVQHAHERGVLHCDLTPANILLNPAGPDTDRLTGFAPQITDFGLARLLDDDPSLTRTYRVAGTPLYMAPEQAAGDRRNLTARADVYALGAVLYDLLTGSPPFPDGTADAVMERVRTAEVTDPRRRVPGLPRDLAAVCMKCLEKRPADRYSSAAALAEDLDRFLTGKPVQARPVSPAVRVGRWAAAHPAVTGLMLMMTAVLAIAGWLTLDAWERGVQAAADARVLDAERRAVELRLADAEFRAALDRVRHRRASRSPGWAAANRADLAALPPSKVDRETDEVRTEAAAVAAAIDLGEPRAVISAFAGYAAAFSPDSRTLAAVARSSGPLGTGYVRLVDADTGADRRRLRFPADRGWELRAGGRLDGGWAVAFSPDGKRLAVGTRAGNVCVWDLEKPEPDPAAQWRHAPAGDGHTAPQEHVTQLAFDDRGRLWSGDERTVAGWDPKRKWREVQRQPGHLPRPAGPTVHPGRAVAPDLAAVAGDLVVRREDGDMLLLTDAVSGQVTGRLVLPDDDQADDNRITDLVINPDGTVLASVAEHAAHLKLWDLVGGRLLAARTLNPGSMRLAFRPDGRGLAVVEDHRVLVFDLPAPAVGAGGVQPFPLDDADLTPDGRRLLTAGTAPTAGQVALAVHDPAAGPALPLWRTLADGPNGNSRRRAALYPTGLHAVAHSGTMYRQWATADQGYQDTGVPIDTRAIRTAPDGTMWAAGGTMVQAWPGGMRWEKAVGGPVSGLWADAAGGLVGRTDGTLLRYARDGKKLASDRIASAAVTGLARDGERVIAGTAAGDVLLLAADGVKTTLAGHTDAVWAVAVGPDGWFATGSADRTVRVWDRTGRPALTLPQTRPVRRLFWSANGRELWVLAEGERAVRRWHLDRLDAAFKEMGLEPLK